MPYNVDDSEDLDEDILSTFLSKPRSLASTKNRKQSDNAGTKVDLEVGLWGLVVMKPWGGLLTLCTEACGS